MRGSGHSTAGAAKFARGSAKRPLAALRTLQRHDRAPDALPHQGRHLVPRRVERGSPATIPQAISRHDQRLAADMGRGRFPFHLRPSGEFSKRAAAELLAVAERGTAYDAFLAGYGDGDDDRHRRPGLDPPPEQAGGGPPLGARGARYAYGRRLVYSGPLYSHMKLADRTIRLHFAHLGGGLVAAGGARAELEGFEIAGANRQFVRAEARIEGDIVVVGSRLVRKPVAVRYGWQSYPYPTFITKRDCRRPLSVPTAGSNKWL